MTLEKHIQQIFNNAMHDVFTLINQQTVIKMDLSNASQTNFYAITRIVCETLKVEVGEVFKKTKKSEIIEAKHLSIWVIQQKYQPERQEIASFFKVDRTTVIHALQKIKDLISINEGRTVNALENIYTKLKLHEQ